MSVVCCVLVILQQSQASHAAGLVDSTAAERKLFDRELVGSNPTAGSNFLARACHQINPRLPPRRGQTDVYVRGPIYPSVVCRCIQIAVKLGMTIKTIPPLWDRIPRNS